MYAWALIRSRYRDDRLLGIQELEGIMELTVKIISFFLEIMRKYPNRKRECIFFLASANYKVGEYKCALKYVNELLSSEPSNSQALDLKDKIEKKLTNGMLFFFDVLYLFLDGVLGLAVAGGLAAAVAGVLMVMYRSKRK